MHVIVLFSIYFNHGNLIILLIMVETLLFPYSLALIILPVRF